MSAYTTTLPEQHRGTMPSLKEQYERLSAAIRGVSEDVTLFEEILEEVNEHFDIRRAHKIKDALQ